MEVIGLGSVSYTHFVTWIVRELFHSYFRVVLYNNQSWVTLSEKSVNCGKVVKFVLESWNFDFGSYSVKINDREKENSLVKDHDSFSTWTKK
jgi:hypothetical protein